VKTGATTEDGETVKNQRRGEWALLSKNRQADGKLCIQKVTL
jgi:hypothetical protein